MKLGIFLAIALIGANVAILANSIPAHSYDLTVSFADTLGGPSLVPRGGTLVPGSGYGFGPNQGLDLGSGLANPANYSIRMIFKLDVISGYRKLLDIQNLSSDQGWYNIKGNLQFYNQKPGSDSVFSAGVFRDVLLTRNGSTGEIKGYVQGNLEVDFIDSDGAGIFTGPNNLIKFFQDDFATGQREASGGTVTRIEIFDQPITPSMVSSVNPSRSPPTLPHLLESTFLKAKRIPTRIWLRPARPSALPGQEISIQVSASNTADTPIPADRDYRIILVAPGAQVTPNEVTISKGESSAMVSVRSSTPGQFAVRASNPDLEQAKRSVYYCGTGQVRGLDFNAVQQRALANGEKIPLTIVLTDGNGHPISDNTPKNIAFDLQGVGQLQPKDGFVPPDQCARDEIAVSFDPGETTVRASLGTLWQERKFLFILPLSPVLFLLILCGGVAGAFIRAAITWPKSRRWPSSRWIVFLISGALVGLCVFLAYYYGFLKVAPQFIGGKGVGLLLGLIGGYMGQVAIDRIANRILPS